MMSKTMLITVKKGIKGASRLKLLAFFSLWLLITPWSQVFAQGSITGTVNNSDMSVPADSELTFWGFLDDTDEEIRTELSDGAGYDNGYWWDDFQNYGTESAGNPYDYLFNNLVNGEFYHLEGLIPSNSYQEENIVLASASNPSKPTGVKATITSTSRVVVSWNEVAGITHHVYRRYTSSNGSLFRLDDTGGSLANPGVSGSFFVDTTVDGVSSYTYMVIGEDASGNYTPHSDEASAKFHLYGYVEYNNEDQEVDKRLAGARVDLYHQDGDSISSTFTREGGEEDGKFVFDVESYYDLDHFFVKIWLDNEICQVWDRETGQDEDLPTGPFVKNSGPPVNGYFGTIDLSTDEKFNRATHGFDYIRRESEFIKDNYTDESGWVRPKLDVFYDENETEGGSFYRCWWPGWQGASQCGEVIFLSKYEEICYRKHAPYHEYAHAVMEHAYNYNVDEGTDPSPHYLWSVTDKKFAWVEGWAHFMPCVVPDPDEPLNFGWVGEEEPDYDMENNNWWSGAWDGTGTNTNGARVEGAVASALYDMMDENYDPEDETKGNMSQTNDAVFNRIFKILVDINPKTVCEFRNEWKRIYEEEDIITKFRGILYGHNIPWEGDLVEQREGQTLPNVYSLSQNYPNPFNPQTEVRFQLPEKCMVEFKIYNIFGRLVKTIVDGQMAPGYYKVSWDGRNEENQQVASGIYFYRLTAESFNQTRKMALIR